MWGQFADASWKNDEMLKRLDAAFSAHNRSFFSEAFATFDSNAFIRLSDQSGLLSSFH